MNVNEKKRSAAYDYVKLFLICGVVLGHLGNSYASKSAMVEAIQFWIYLFHMPAFIFISGCFAKRAINEGQWLKRSSFLLIYALMEVLPSIYGMIFEGKPRTIDWLHEYNEPWFAIAMFWWFAMAVCLRKLPAKVVFVGSVIVAALYGYAPFFSSFLSMNRTINFFCFFWLGYIIDPTSLREKLRAPWIRIASTIFLAVTFVISRLYIDRLSQWRILFRGLRSYVRFEVEYNTNWGGLWRILAVVISLVFILALISIAPDRKTFIAKLGGKTLPVFVFEKQARAIFLNQTSWCRPWIESGHLAIKNTILMVVIVAVLTLPPFDWFVRMIMNLPEWIAKKLKRNR